MKKEPFKKILNQGQPVYYRFINNNSKETVVFIHGLFSSSSIFRHFLKLIKKNVILIELRGIVYSKCQRPFLKNYVEDIRLVLEREKIDKNVILVGYSLGCSIANLFAETFSKMVNKVIMLSPINRTFREIGKKNFIKSLITGLGKDFLKKWKDYRRVENNWPFYKIFSLFNLKLLKDTYQKIDLTRKCSIFILNGSDDTFFNPADELLKLPNVIRKEINELDHFLFLTSERIQRIGAELAPILETVEI